MTCCVHNDWATIVWVGSAAIRGQPKFGQDREVLGWKSGYLVLALTKTGILVAGGSLPVRVLSPLCVRDPCPAVKGVICPRAEGIAGLNRIYFTLRMYSKRFLASIVHMVRCLRPNDSLLRAGSFFTLQQNELEFIFRRFFSGSALWHCFCQFRIYYDQVHNLIIDVRTLCPSSSMR